MYKILIFSFVTIVANYPQLNFEQLPLDLQKQIILMASANKNSIKSIYNLRKLAEVNKHFHSIIMYDQQFAQEIYCSSFINKDFETALTVRTPAMKNYIIELFGGNPKEVTTDAQQVNFIQVRNPSILSNTCIYTLMRTPYCIAKLKALPKYNLRTLMQDYIKTGHFQYIKSLILAGIDVNKPLPLWKETYLMKAVEAGNTQCIQLLLNHGASVNVQAVYLDNYQKHVLDYTADLELPVKTIKKIILMFLKKSYDINKQSENRNYTALIHAAFRCNKNTIIALLECGADSKLKNYKNETALDILNRRVKEAHLSLLDFQELKPLLE